MDSAYDAATFRPEMVILLGILPETPEVEYGWIEPGIPLGSPVPSNICRVNRFWEKPSPDACVGLDGAWLSMEQLRYGWPRSSFPKPHAARASRLVEAFESIRSSFFTAYERPVCPTFTSAFAPPAFLRTSYQRSQMGLAVLRATGLGWSDLGEPGRVFSCILAQRRPERMGVQTGIRGPAGNARKAADG